MFPCALTVFFPPPLFSVRLAGLFIRVQAGAVPGVRRLLHVRSSEGIAQPVSPAHQNTRGLHLPTELDHGQRDAQPRACHDLSQQGQVCCCSAIVCGRCCYYAAEIFNVK